MDQDLSKMKVSELREALKAKGLNTTGNKQELIDRLTASNSDSVIDPKFEDELLNDDDLESEEKSLLDSTNDLLKSPDSSKSSTPESAPPPKKISLKRNVCIETPVFPEEKTDSTVSDKNDVSEPDKKVVKISELSAKDRLEMRAKKFGANSSVTVNSAPPSAKLEARAARFGISAPTSSSTVSVSNSTTTDVLQKRAERFGAISVTAKKVELEDKLNKRKERFGSEGKVTITAPGKTSDEYAEKARLRLERFKQTA
ncbi:SAP domain-containing ribonucleoprotein [Chironomus tepperi]|uniref:SAP domain-containing ribonucleoprotein n=1 Tax=Chironomus tepperi TaxID=113505 RepID=UPI00391F2412